MTNMKKYREKRGCSTKFVADYLGVSESSYINMEELDTFVDLRTLVKLADLYGTSLDVIVDRKPIPRDFTITGKPFVSIGYSDGHQRHYRITDRQADLINLLVMHLLEKKDD